MNAANANGRTRLGLDMGSNSIGWCLLGIDATRNPTSVIDCGVLLLTPNQEAGRDPQSNATLAADRRVKRSMRKRRDRFLRRQKRLMEALIASELMPKDEAKRKDLEKLDPYELRARALDERLEPSELGRALFHLGQRRGFKSNRIADGDDNEKGAMRAGMRALEAELEKEIDGKPSRTLGEWQFLTLREQNRIINDKNATKEQKQEALKTREGVRFRPRKNGAKIEYPLYPNREMIAAELAAILEKQAAFHPQVDERLRKKLARIIIEQRPLKPQPVGKCTFRPNEDRAPKALPTFQRFRVLSDLASLRIEIPGVGSRRLTLQERDALANKLMMARSSAKVEFEKLRKALKSFPEGARFNYEKQDRKGFDPDLTTTAVAARFKKHGLEKGAEAWWRALPRSRQTEIVEKLIAEEDADALIDWLVSNIGVSADIAEALSDARLPQGYGSLGRSMLTNLIDVMENESIEAVDRSTGEIFAAPLGYDEAVARLELHHSDHRQEGNLAKLPYYGDVMKRHVIERSSAPEGSQERRGRVPNPTVHIALNQVRKLVNAIIETHGAPDEIVMELGRELKSNQKSKDEYKRKLNDNTAANERRKKDVQALNDEYGLGVEFNGETKLRLRLYDELPPDERVCVYTGKPIGRQDLFTGEIEVDHILPFSKTLDDSFGNKVLCARDGNRRKGVRSPAAAFSGADLTEIAERAERLFKSKAWRFQPDAMEKFEERRDFIDRHLVDTQHLSRLAKDYLGYVCDPDKVWAVPGRMTAMLRGLWGLNQGLLPDHNAPTGKKNRNDHRHHAVDAFVIACTHRGMLQEIARRSAINEEQDGARLLDRETIPEPFDGFRAALQSKLQAIVVCHKADHGLDPKAKGKAQKNRFGVSAGRLHEETAFGLVREEIDGKEFNLVTRKPIAALTPNEIDQVRDRELRETLQGLRDSIGGEKKNLADALAAFGSENGIRRVRVLKRDEYRVISHGDGHKKAYAPGENHCVEIYETVSGEWAGEGITVFDAHAVAFRPSWRTGEPTARLVMRVHKGDLIEADFDGARKVYRAYRLEPSAKRLRLAAHNESGALEKRHADEADPFRWVFATYARLKEAKASRVRVDALGRVRPVKDK